MGKKGFTLIELLAVITVLAIILVIAVPNVLNMIRNSKLSAMGSSAKIIARKAEDYYTQRKMKDRTYNPASISCTDIVNKTEDYGTCTITYDSEGVATVKLMGAAGKKFNNMVCEGTKDNMNCKEKGVPLPGYTNAEAYIVGLCTGTCPNSVVNNETIDGAANSNGVIQDRYGNYRYQGNDPNNYVTFNGEIAGWRIIGLFNGRVKLVKSESIGNYSWDSAPQSGTPAGNGGYGINQWGESVYEDGTPYEGADLMRLLNNYYYDGVEGGRCYGGQNNSNRSCSFDGLTSEAKDLIGDSLWYLGTLRSNPSYTITDMYEDETGNLGKTCEYNYFGCGDTVVRTTRWTGKVGLIYPTDFGYASMDVNCLNNINNSQSCGINKNWMYVYGWTMTPYSNGSTRVLSASINIALYYPVASPDSVHPVVYLIPGVQMKATNPDDTTNAPGSKNNPYVFAD